MNFNLTNEQAQIREAVRDWVSGSYALLRRMDIVKAGGFSRVAYDELAALGIPGIQVPEAFGGLGLSAVEVMLTMEELGRGVVLEPLCDVLVAAATLVACGHADVKSEWLASMSDGRTLMVLAWQERGARYRMNACEATAVQVNGVWLLTGIKSLVPAGDKADAFLTPAMVDGTMAIFLVKARAEHVTTHAYATQDGGRAAELVMDGAPAELVTMDGATALAYAFDMGAAASCAEGVGVMEQTLAATVEYLHMRKQFGVPLSSFQALRHRVADMKMQLELARSMAYYATLMLDAPAAERRMAVSRAKYQLGNSMRFVGQQALQLHGGIGMTDEYVVSHHFRRLTQLEFAFGDSPYHLDVVSSGLQKTAGVFA